MKTVHLEENGRKEIDIKKYARVEKIPGASIEESCVLDGILLNKDVIHSSMRRYFIFLNVFEIYIFYLKTDRESSNFAYGLRP